MLNINDVIKVSKGIQDNIRAGEVGTVVHIFDVIPPVYEIEFSDDQGRTIETVPLKEGVSGKPCDLTCVQLNV